MNKIFLSTTYILAFLFGNCNQTPIEETKEKELTLLWSVEYLDESVSLSSVSNSPTVINDTMVLLAVDEAITSIDVYSGEINWRYKLPEGSPIVTTKLMHENGIVYLKHDRLNRATALNIENGTINWQLTLSEGDFFDFRSDAMSETMLYLTGNDQELYEVSKQGEFQRKIQLEYSMRSGHYFQDDLIIAHAYRDTDLSPFAFGQIIRYDLSSDTLKWKYETNTGGYYYTPILLEDEIIYAGTTEGLGEFATLNVHTGEVLWRIPDLGAWAYTLSEEAIYINEGADLVALRKTDGQQLWRTPFPGGGFGQSNIAYMDDFVYHSHSGSFFVLDAETGEILLQTSLPDGSNSRNVSADFGKVFVQSDYHLYAYEGWQSE